MKLRKTDTTEEIDELAGKETKKMKKTGEDNKLGAGKSLSRCPYRSDRVVWGVALLLTMRGRDTRKSKRQTTEKLRSTF